MSWAFSSNFCNPPLADGVARLDPTVLSRTLLAARTDRTLERAIGRAIDPDGSAERSIVSSDASPSLRRARDSTRSRETLLL
ncbi:hypothetical protein C492_14901 [Natronococcus jeotgali DSM 18795]|uniref:Uncharacterized protein n=1 Tax=Natronococcus jeotgali DSM 18795 TaxID=1227498 RepID=L9X3W3_9EURY|nr:hypothetical protein C492_14901 [Natronococcus jeotgali DSM 18795]